MSEQVIDQNPTETASFDPFADHTYEQVGEPTLGQPHKRRRTSRVDTVLAQAKDVALAGIEQIAPKNTIGLLHHLRGEEDRLTTHLFECTLPGYRGWFWFATLARAPRSKVATVCEVGLLPGDDALLAPDWVPWAQRLQELPDTADLDEALAADPEDVYEDEEPQFDAATEPPETGGKSRKARRSARKAQNRKNLNRQRAGGQKASQGNSVPQQDAPQKSGGRKGSGRGSGGRKRAKTSAARNSEG